MKLNKLVLFSLIFLLTPSVFSIKVLDSTRTEKKALIYIKNQRYKQAIRLIQRGLPRFTQKEKMLYLLSRCYENSNQLKKSLKTYQLLVQKYPNSKWSQKSYFRQAHIFIKQKKFSKSYSILKKRLKVLLEPERRSQFSQIYLKLAEEISFQKDEKKNDYKKALPFYQRAVEMGSLGNQEAKTHYRIGLCFFHLKNYLKAKEILYQFINQFPHSPYVKEAHFYLGKIEHKLGFSYKSRTHFFDVLKSEKSGEKEKNLSPKTLYHIGKSYRLPYPPSEEELELGVKYLRLLINKYPKHKLAPKAAYEIGLSYNRFTNLKERAIKELLSFVETYPSDLNAPLALDLVGKIYISKNEYDKSLDHFIKFLKDYPNHKLWQNIQRQLINTKLNKGDYYFNLKQYLSAENIYQSFLKEYPIDSRNPRILFTLGNISFLQKKYEMAIERWNKLFSKYPDYKIAHKALFSIGKIYVDQKYQFEKGIETFKKIKLYPWLQKAKNEIRLLKEKSLSLKTKRLFLSNESPQVEVKTRNIKEFKVHIFSLNLKEYFRRNHTLKKIEQLDTLLIKADQSYTHPIENYQKHRLFTINLPLKVKKAGTYIISVTTETLKASSLVLISDLGLIVHGNKREILIYTKNLRKERGEARTRVLVSNGKKIIFEGESNNKGIFTHKFSKSEKRLNLDDLIILVEKKGHYAGTGIKTRVFSEQDEKENLAYLYSDKPVYKPGDSFSYKGILRILHKGVLGRIKSKSFLVQFMSPSGEKIYEKKVTQSAYGSVTGKFTLPKTTTTGWGKLRVLSTKDKTIAFEKQFEITEYTKLEKEILFETDKVAYFPRDIIKLKMIGKHLFGLPAAGKTLFYKVVQESYQSAKLDDEGVFNLEIPSVKYGRRSSIRIYAYLEGGNKTFEKSIPIIIRDFSISLKSNKAIYLPTEKGLIEIKTTDFFTKGISKKLLLQLYLLKNDKEQFISKLETETDKNGLGEAKFTFEEGGLYLVKAEGLGRNDIPVRVRLYFSVIKKKEKQKLFILSENKPLKVYDQAKMILYSQGKAGLALLTIKGKNILSHRLIRIKSGKNPLSFPITESLVPNFQISISLLKPEDFYHVEKRFQVESGINIKISTNKAVYRPGEHIILTIDTKGVNQQPLSTESSIVLIDEGVLHLTGTRLEDIKKYFYRKRFFPSHNQSGSTPYEYLSKTEMRNLEIARKLKDRNKITLIIKKHKRKGRLSSSLRGGMGFSSADENISGKARGYSDLEKAEEKRFDQPVAKPNAPRGLNQLVDKFSEYKKRQISKVRELLADTAYFNPSVITDDDGVATIKIKLPNSHNKWRILVISTSRGSQFGMSEKSISVRKDFLVHIETPIALVEGDNFSFDGDLLNASKDDKEGDLKLMVNGKTKSIHYTVKPKGHFSFQSNKIFVKGKKLKVSGITEYDGERRFIPVTPWGSSFYKGITGSTSDKKKEWIPFDDPSAQDVQFKLTLYPNFNQVLSTIDDSFRLSSYTFLNQVASHLITKLSLYQYLKAYEKNRIGDIRRLQTEIKDKISFLTASMNKYGGWNWIYRRGDRDTVISAFVYYALSLAKNDKFKVNSTAINKSTRFLNKRFSNLSNNDLETKIFILYSLSQNKKANYSYVNRIYRNKNRLSLRGLNLLALTLHNMKRLGDAKQILALIETKVNDPQFKDWNRKGSRGLTLDFLSSKDEIIALSILSLLKIKKYTFKAKPFMIKLLSNLPRKGLVTGEFLAILSQGISRYLLYQKPSQTNFMLTVKWNDQVIFKKRMTGIHLPQHLTVTKNILQKNKLEFLVQGKGEVFYSGHLSYFKPGVIREKFEKYGWLTKRLKYPNYKLGVKEFSWGYSTVQVSSYSSKHQILKQVAQHTIFPVSIKLHLSKSMPETYFILEDTIPSGCTLLQKSVTGGFQYYKQEKNKLLFYLKRSSPKSSYIYLNYKLISRFQGVYRTLPPEVYSIRNREKMISGKVTNLSILNSTYDPFKDYKFSPDEYYHIGKYYFDKKEYQKSENYLTKVFTSYTLKDTYYKEACRMFLYISLNKKNAEEVVKYFELLKERYPTLTIPFKEVIKIADSYGKIGEYERAIQVLNGTIKSYFLQEVAIAGTLSQHKRINEAYNLLNQLLFSYPDDSIVLKTFYTFGQDIYLRYTEMTENQKAKTERKITPERLFHISKEIFNNYLVYYPEDSNCDEVGFTLVNLFLDHKNYENTIRHALSYSKLYSKSQFLDGYKYIAAHALFRKGNYRLAYKLSKSVAYDKFPGAEGTLRESENKHFAIHMLAKIFHHQKKFLRAQEEYEKVSDKFADARRSVEFIQEKKIVLKEVTQIRKKEKNQIELTFKGVNTVFLKLYKVDFTILCLKEKDLTNITKINLSGIKPFFEKRYVLSKRIPYTPVKKVIKIPLKKVGAYLIVFKTKDVQGSGIVLKSNLSFDAIEKTDLGRIRVTVLDHKSQFVKGVKIKFIGSGKNQYRSAITDLRGTAEVDHFRNLALVVGEKDGHYCFYRGKRPIIKTMQPVSQPPKAMPVQKEESLEGLGNIRRQRSNIQKLNRAYWNEQSDKADIQGVEIKELK